MKEIHLTQGQVAVVDDADYEWLSQYKWYAMWCEGTKSFYAVRKEGWPHRKNVGMHRKIMATPDGMECDHINHDTLFNCRENLRNVTHSQNQMNRRVHSNNKLGEKCIRPTHNGFEVKVKVGGKYVYCKYFGNLEAAITARDEAVKQHHGEYASAKEGK